MFNLKNLLLIGIAAHAVLLLLNFGVLFNSEQQYLFPLMLIGAALVVRKRKSEIQEFLDDPATSKESLSLLSIFGFGLVIAVGMLAGLGDISYLGWMSFVLLWVVAIASAWGKQGIVNALPLLVLAVLVRPFPDFIDERIQSALRYVEILFASLGLDLLQVMHFRNTDTIQLVLMDFSADTACSRVFMLYPAVWFIVVRGMLARYTWIRHAVQITQTVFWVVILNAIHIICVLMIEQSGSVSIASGAPHYISLAVLFSAIVAFSLSTDSLFNAIVPNPNMEDELEALEGVVNTPEVKWNKLGMQVVEGVSKVVASSTSWAALAAGFLLMLFVSVRIYFAPEQNVSSVDLSTIPALTLSRDAMPDEIKGWRLAEFEDKAVNDEEPESNVRTLVWKYRKDSREVAFSILGPHSEYTDPSSRYLLAGWKLSFENDFTPVYSLLAGKKDDSKNIAFIRLAKNSGERGVVVCSCIDAKGATVPPRLGLTKNYREYMAEKFYSSALYVVGARSTPHTRSLLFRPPVYAIQFSHEMNDRLKLKDDEAYQIFDACRKAVQVSSSFSSGK